MADPNSSGERCGKEYCLMFAEYPARSACSGVQKYAGQPRSIENLVSEKA